MKILIICSYYPPDTAIAAVRPHMFAKYLAQLGNEVCVICSGKIHERIDDYDEEYNKNIKIIKYSKSFNIFKLNKIRNSKINILYGEIDKLITFVSNKIIKNKWKKNYSKIKKIINSIKNDHCFDVVIGTYAEIENLFGAEYASKSFDCKFVVDFRDPIAQQSIQTHGDYIKNKKIQDYFIDKADLCLCVSDDLRKILSDNQDNMKIKTLTNGFNPIISMNNRISIPKNVFTMCYTGQYYSDRQKYSLNVLVLALEKLIKEKKIDSSKIRFVYAGQNSRKIERAFENLPNILINYGYISKDKVTYIQSISDIFCVFSWNNKFEQGVITGKFYEGVRLNKKILCLVSGEVKNSELYRLNQKYNYGYCHEEANDKTTLNELCGFIYESYMNYVNKNETNTYNEELFNAYNYMKIVERLNALLTI